MKKDLKRAKKLEDKIFHDIKEYLGKNQNLKEDYQRLSTIPGIGEKAAIALLALFKTYKVQIGHRSLLLPDLIRSKENLEPR